VTPSLPVPASSLWTSSFLGIRSSSLAPTPCFVVSDSWPGWLSILPSFGFTCSVLLITDASVPWLAALLQSHPRCRVVPLSDATKVDFSGYSFGFLQGSHRLYSLISTPSAHIVHSLDFPAPSPPPGPFLLSLFHPDYGGVVSGRWDFYSSCPLDIPAPANVEGRTLFHLIDCTRRVSNFQAAAPAPQFLPIPNVEWVDEAQIVLDGCGWLPLAHVNGLIRCPLNFSPTRWATRRLTSKEMLSVFDWSEGLLEVFPEGSKLPFLSSAPGRLLGAILGALPHASKPKITPLNHALLLQEPHSQHETLHWPVQPGTEWHGVSESTTTSDETRPPAELWNIRVMNRFENAWHLYQGFEARRGYGPLEAIRDFLLRAWRRRVLRSLLRYLAHQHGCAGRERDLEVGRDCISIVSTASWWEWNRGSTPFFWRWPLHARCLVRDGHLPYFLKTPPRCVKPQRREPDDSIRQKTLSKLQTVIQRGYIATGEVESLTLYFAVPKGVDDIRMVYDATASGLNACLWAPSFWLPSAESLVETMTGSSWMGDLDMGEQFLNFPLHPSLQRFCGIDLRPLLDPTSPTTIWLRWTRCMMGLRPSPYYSIQGTYLAEELVAGDRRDPTNPLQWESVYLNLPGSDAYDPTQPWVQLRTATGDLAAACKRYVDDFRTVGDSEEHCWQVTHKFASMFSYLGLQIALRKLRPPSQHPGPWAGTIAFSCEVGVGVTCPVGKWLKAKNLIAALQTHLEAGLPLPRKSLESTRGFFVHLMRTFPIITPYLKGIHLTLDGWRAHRDADMWKLPPALRVETQEPLPADAPMTLIPAPRLPDDVFCLAQLFSANNPPTRMMRCTRRCIAIYGFVDASAAGFGSSFELPDKSILFRHGLWGRDADSATSKFRELCNLVDAIEQGVQCGELEHTELFIFTDNTTAEGAYYKGNSDSRTLFALVLRLRRLEMSASLRLHLIYVAGTRMVQQGTDGLSRGLLTDGVFGSDSMRFHVPLHLPAHSRHPLVLPWIQSWCPVSGITPLSPEGWFINGHGLLDTRTSGPDRTRHPVLSPASWFLWSPPPAAARAALEELAISRLKRPHLNHIVVCPRLFTSQWRRLLFKIADFVFEIPAGARPCWPLSMHEPLVVGLTLRLLSIPPFSLRQHPSLLELGRTLQGLWPYVSCDERGVLRQLCDIPLTLDPVP